MSLGTICCGFFGTWAGNIALSSAATAAGADILSQYNHDIDTGDSVKAAALGNFIGSIAVAYSVVKYIQHECNLLPESICCSALLIDAALIASTTAFTAAGALLLDINPAESAMACATGTATIYSTLALAGACCIESTRQCLDN